MMNNKGQALMEFILILPVFILLIFGMIEIGNLIHQKYLLETHVDPIIELYKDDTNLIGTYEKSNDITTTFEVDGNLVKLTVAKDVKLITPGVTNFLGNPYKIKTERTFYVGEANES